MLKWEYIANGLRELQSVLPALYKLRGQKNSAVTKYIHYYGEGT